MIGWIRKALTAMRHGGRAPLMRAMLARTKFDYAREVGSGIDSSVVTAPVQWVQRAFPEARLRVVRVTDGNREELEGHELTALVSNPNPFYSDEALVSATVFSYLVAGNAYWLKVRNLNGRVRELWYAPHWTLTPKWPDDGSEFISHYQYRPGAGRPIDLDVEDVIHFRHGIDPRNPRLGLSPIHGVIREIFMDLEASNFVASLLRNMGIPGVIISPNNAAAPQEDVEAVKKWFAENFGGDRRGLPLVMSSPTDVHEYGFNPQQMDLSPSRNVAEERVCASIGIPAAVVGFGAGLETAKVGATMSELRQLAWTNGILPLMRTFAGEIGRSLLPDFRPGQGRIEVEYDTSMVKALEETDKSKADKWNAMVGGGWAEVAEAREANGLEVNDSHRIFLRPFSAVEVPAGAPPRPASGSAARAGKSESIDLRGMLKDPDKQDRAQPTRAQAAYVRRLEEMAAPLEKMFRPKLESFFGGLGAAAASTARPLMGEAAGRPAEGEKQTPEDDILIAQILDALGIAEHEATFRRLYEAHFVAVAEEVSKAGELLGLATDLPDPVARAVAAAGGRRAGLIDLSSQSRRALFDAVAEGRAAGEGVQQLAGRIEEHVAAGPWSTVETRARTIARTETKFAQNTSTIARAQFEGVDRFIVFDGRYGPGRSDPAHIARDGRIVTSDEATNLAATEHPNGTLSFSPYYGEEGSA